MTVVGIVVVLALTAATGYFVAQEFAYMAVDRSRLQVGAAAGDAGAKRALDITRRTSFMLSGAQLGITVTGLLVGYVAEPLIGVSLHHRFPPSISSGPPRRRDRGLCRLPPPRPAPTPAARCPIGGREPPEPHTAQLIYRPDSRKDRNSGYVVSPADD